MGDRPTYGSGRYSSARGGSGGSARGGLVAGVAAGSPAAVAGVAPGHRIVSANGRVLTDVLAWWWESDGRSVDIELVLADDDRPEFTRGVTLLREEGEQWGIEFADPLFDGVRTCQNRCEFCFMSQLPKGLRRALYLRDDDYRLSFLNGNFITLTNLDEADVSRIIAERLSPLYVSLHAVSPDVRSRLICAREDRALEHFDALVEGGIDLHVQIVLVPDANDGDELQRTLAWLAAREGVVSVGVVPLGYTAHQSRFARSYEDPHAAAEVLDALEPWAAAMRQRDGVSWVYAADELYLTAARDLPPAEEYDGYPQYENGIGLVRSFIDEFIAEELLSDAVVVTGELFAPVLRDLIAQHATSLSLHVLAVENRFFGGNVSVTGLLTGGDIARAVRESGHSTRVLVPDVIFNDSGLTLDDMTVSEIAAAAGTRLTVVRSDAGGLLSGIL